MKKFLILIFAICFSADNFALVTKSKGDVKYKKNDASSTDSKLGMGTPLFSNDLIKTGADGFAIFVYLDDKSMIKVQKNSEMYVRGNVDKGEIQIEDLTPEDRQTIIDIRMQNESGDNIK